MKYLLGVPLLVLLTSCAWQRSTFELNELYPETLSTYDDRFAIILDTDKGSDYYCPGVRGGWVGNNFFFMPIRARVGESPPTDYPAVVQPENPWHSIVWVNREHVPHNDVLNVYRCDASGRYRSIGGFRRLEAAQQALAADAASQRR